jgi:hypothetical protein
METMTFVRGQEVRALLEATAIARLVDTLDMMIEDADRRAADDAIAEHCATSWRWRRDALLKEHAALTGAPIAARP